MGRVLGPRCGHAVATNASRKAANRSSCCSYFTGDRRRGYNRGHVSEPEEPVRKQEDEPMLYCPVCSKRLSERKCKLFCEQCGYYMSCADYY